MPTNTSVYITSTESFQSNSNRLLQLACATHLIRDVCNALRSPFTVSINARLLFHKFYISIPLKDACTIWMAGAAILLASKLADAPHSLRHVASVIYDRIRAREANRAPKISPVELEGTIYNRPLDFYGAQGYEWKRSLIVAERLMLRQLGFRLETKSPQKLVLVFVNAIRENSKAPSFGQSNSRIYRNLLQLAWNYANDSLAAPLCVIERPEVIACACIGLAMRKCDGELPSSWQMVFGCDTIVCERIEKEIEVIYDLGETRGRMIDYSESEVFEWLHPQSNVIKVCSNKKSSEQGNEVIETSESKTEDITKNEIECNPGIDRNKRDDDNEGGDKDECVSKRRRLADTQPTGC